MDLGAMQTLLDVIVLHPAILMASLHTDLLTAGPASVEDTTIPTSPPKKDSGTKLRIFAFTVEDQTTL
jgi:hypothetical protein